MNPMPKPKPKKHTYEIVTKHTLRCAPGKLRGHMRRRKSELAVNTGNGEVIEHWEDIADKQDGDLWL
jgi:hypothetical protein